jgi:hypothetical protein
MDGGRERKKSGKDRWGEGRGGERLNKKRGRGERRG